MVRRICFPMYWASPSGVVAIRLFLRGDRRRADRGLSGATMRSLFFCVRGVGSLCFLFSKACASAIFPTLTALSVVRPVALFAERGSARLFGARFSRGPLTSLRQRRRERAGQLEFSAARPSAVRKQRAPPSAGGWRSWERGPPLRELPPGVLWQPPRQIAREL